MRIFTTLFCSILFSLLWSQQSPTYLKFYDAFSTYSLDDISNSECEMYKFDQNPPIKSFPDYFRFQITENVKISTETKQGVNCVKVSVDNYDHNCGGGESSVRSEIMYTKLTNSGIGWYKLRFYIPSGFKISNSNINHGEHHIFQIFMNQTLSDVKVRPLPIFFMSFDHQASSSSNAVLNLKYGLEFRVNSGYIDTDCTGCPDGIDQTYENANCSLGVNNVADLNNQYWGGNSSKEVKNLSVNYDQWNEIIFKINWRDDYQGYMDVILNDFSIYTFTGPNVYNTSMIPLIDGIPENHKTAVACKFGHYSYIHGYSVNPIESNIYFDYFYADSDLHNNNIQNDLQTTITNDESGIINFWDNISCDEIFGADDYIFLIRDTQTGIDQYVGSQYNGLSIYNLLQNVDIDFDKNYLVAIRTQFNEGFDSPYSDPKLVKFKPVSELSENYCNNNNINYNTILSAIPVLEANEYVYNIYDTVTGNSYYSGTSTGQNNVSTLFSQHNLSFNRSYKIAVRPKFDNYNLQGFYGKSCNVIFKSNIFEPFEKDGISIFPNPADDYIYIKGKLSETNYVIYDIYGKIILKGKGMKSNRIDISHLKKGNYILLINGKSLIIHKK